MARGPEAGGPLERRVGRIMVILGDYYENNGLGGEGMIDALTYLKD